MIKRIKGGKRRDSFFCFRGGRIVTYLTSREIVAGQLVSKYLTQCTGNALIAGARCVL